MVVASLSTAMDDAVKRVGGPDLFSFTYHDNYKAADITENLSIDRHAGFCMWNRGSDGKVWLRSQVISVNFRTRLGDPGREFLSPAQRRRKGVMNYISKNSPVCLLLAGTFFNFLTLTLCAAAGLAYTLWRAFPRMGEGYNMGRGPVPEALVTAFGLAFVSAICAMLAGWWLGVFRCRCLRQKHLGALGARQDDTAASRWKCQRPIGRAVLSAFILWCVFVIVVCPLAYFLSMEQQCGLGGCEVEAGSTALPTCGVGSCTCNMAADLMCTPSSQVSSEESGICKFVTQPLCVAGGSAGSASGMRWPLLVAALGTSGMCGALVLVWLLSVAAMYCDLLLDQVSQFVPPEAPPVDYHSFCINFRSRGGAPDKVVFNLAGAEDPHAIVAALMPSVGGLIPPPAVGTDTLRLYQSVMGGLETDAGSTGVPTVFDAEADNTELEPQWC